MIYVNPQIPKVYPTGYYISLDFPIWILVIIIGFIGGILFVIKGFQSEVKAKKGMFVGAGLLLIFMGITRIFYLIAVIYPINYQFVSDLAYLFETTGLLLFLAFAERFIFVKTKYILTIISAVGIVLVILSLTKITLTSIARLGSTIIVAIISIGILYIFSKLIYLSVGNVRTRAILGTLGILLFFIGGFMDSELVYTLWPSMPILLTPIMSLIGIIFIQIIQSDTKLRIRKTKREKSKHT